MKHLDTTDRKNVNVLGEEQLAQVVGGHRRWGHGHHGGMNKHRGNGMNRGGGGGGQGRGGGMSRRGGQGGGGGDINIFLAPGAVLVLGDGNVADVTNF